MLQGCREGYCEYDPATEILCWVYDVLSEYCLTCSSGLMDSKTHFYFSDPWSFRGRVNFSMFDIVNPLWCWLLRLNPRAWGEHLTSQLSWVADWLLVTCVCPVYLVKEGYYFRSDYFSLGERWAGKGGRVVSQEGGKDVWLEWRDKVGKVCEWSECEVTSWEWWQNNEVVWLERWERNEVAIWERWDGSEQGRWMEFKDEIMLHYSREAKCMQGFYNSYIILWIIILNLHRWASS